MITNLDLNVKVGPQFYRYSEGAIDLVTDILSEYHAKKILVVHGTISWKKVQSFLKELFNYDAEILYEKYSGECSYNEGKRIADIIEKEKIDFVIGVGGGKLADLTLYSCHLANVNFGIISTLPSNCAPWTPLSVMYKDNGMAEGKTEHVKKQAVFLLSDPNLMIDSPKKYFIAGIADTIAKWYESDMILEQEKYLDEPFLQLARKAAEICKNQILDESIQAIEDIDNKKVTSEFIHVSEIVFAFAGIVGGLGDKYARNTAAHAMHDSLSANIPEVHEYLHGEIVAYGILYQLALESKWSAIDDLLPLYKELNLPMSLTEMNAYPMSEEKLDDVVNLVNKKEKVHLLPIEINESALKKAIIDLEVYIKNKEV